MTEKKPRPPVTQIKKPSVLVLHEKHERRYFRADDDAALFKAALHIVQERSRAGYYYAEPEKPKDLGITKEQIETLPEVLRTEARRKLAEYRSAVKWYLWELEVWELVKQAVENQDGQAAWQVLRERSAAEYENVTVETLVLID